MPVWPRPASWSCDRCATVSAGSQGAGRTSRCRGTATLCTRFRLPACPSPSEGINARSVLRLGRPRSDRGFRASGRIAQLDGPRRLGAGDNGDARGVMKVDPAARTGTKRSHARCGIVADQADLGFVARRRPVTEALRRHMRVWMYIFAARASARFAGHPALSLSLSRIFGTAGHFFLGSKVRGQAFSDQLAAVGPEAVP